MQAMASLLRQLAQKAGTPLRVVMGLVGFSPGPNMEKLNDALQKEFLEVCGARAR